MYGKIYNDLVLCVAGSRRRSAIYIEASSQKVMAGKTLKGIVHRRRTDGPPLRCDDLRQDIPHFLD